jgi:hypothetical protein
MFTNYRYIRSFKEIGIGDISSVRGKNGSLGDGCARCASACRTRESRDAATPRR